MYWDVLHPVLLMKWNPCIHVRPDRHWSLWCSLLKPGEQVAEGSKGMPGALSAEPWLYYFGIHPKRLAPPKCTCHVWPIHKNWTVSNVVRMMAPVPDLRVNYGYGEVALIISLQFWCLYLHVTTQTRRRWGKAAWTQKVKARLLRPWASHISVA